MAREDGRERLEELNPSCKIKGYGPVFHVLFQSMLGSMGFDIHAPGSCLPTFRVEPPGDRARGPLFFTIRAARFGACVPPARSQEGDERVALRERSRAVVGTAGMG